MAVCSACGSEVGDASKFCTSCGQRMQARAVTPPVIDGGTQLCLACGARVDRFSTFCTNCGHQLPAVPATPSPAKSEPVAPSPVPAPSVPVADVMAAAPVPATFPAVSPQLTTAPEEAVASHPLETIPQPEPQFYPPPAIYRTQLQPSGSRFGLMVLILLIVIIAAGFGGWYFWGVETIVVCSPPDARVSLDDKELSPTSFGRYVIPHLSRKTHLIKVQRQGFADTIQRLDFPLSSSQGWVNIVLVPSRPLRR
ncbi:MAG: zinc ribbon domain-containing protein [Candidatus Angelobacter sp.]